MNPAANPSPDFDALVIGAGPAGGRAALGLARSGHRVLIVEKQDWPRPKVCGCCLNAAALATLRSAGLHRALAALGPRQIRALEMRSGGRRARLGLPAGVALSRPALDGLLVDAAVAAGATFRAGVSACVLPGDHAGWHHVVLAGGGVRARCVVVADGLAGTALRDWPAFRPVAQANGRVGLGVHLPAGHPIACVLADETITMLCGRRGYLGAVRLEDGSIDLAAAADRSALKHHRGAGGLARAIAADAGVDFDDAASWPWRITPVLTRSRQRLAAPGLFVVGDAAGYVEPFTGEGMAWALAGGAAVVPHVARAIAGVGGMGWPATYRRTVARRQRGCCAVSRLMRHPRLTRATVALLSVAPFMAAPLVPRAPVGSGVAA